MSSETGAELHKKIEQLELKYKKLNENVERLASSSISKKDLERVDVWLEEGWAHIFFELKLTDSDIENLIRFITENRNERDQIVKRVLEFYEENHSRIIKAQIIFIIRALISEELAGKEWWMSGVEKRLHQLIYYISEPREEIKNENWDPNAIVARLEFIKQNIEPIYKQWNKTGH